ncbi:hypothetical protein Q73_15445 [Bacillus coahuilensis m2-6]|uniref:NAD(P)/FAD-dependent oxidoreductase n=1 Tax=Bacillus coahuilensis TaxID=408580 RepID=UPI00018506CB|nr:FAD-dependent oxidoreductase [Bacillus coahuilensis]KUP04519.1 hypothetical protein Q73_15445 [Bacillus coahuilensis m2-6]
MKRIVLVGGGHAHLHCLRELQEDYFHNIEWILVSSSRYQYYSGMFSGYTEGLYTEEDIRVDLEKLCLSANVTFKEMTVMSIDPKSQKLLGDQGDILDYDILSLDIGSLNTNPTIDGLDQHNLKIKPNHLFSEKIEQLRSSEKPVIIGGGAAGVEMALSLQAWHKKQHTGVHVTLIHSSPVMEETGEKASKRLAQIVEESGIRSIQQRVSSVTGTHLVTKAGDEVLYDEVLYLGGPTAPRLLKSSKLPVDENGYLLLNSHLQTDLYPMIFGAGDCISLESHQDTPRNGVNAVRQGPVLYHNLVSQAKGEALQTYTPQRRFLAILSTGGKRGFLVYEQLVVSGRWAWHLKNWIDKSFIQKNSV